MKTKKRAIRRVVNVPPLGSVDVCTLARGEEAAVDVCTLARGEGAAVLGLGPAASVGSVGGVDAPIGSLAKRQCRGRPAAGQVSIPVMPIHHPNTDNGKESDTFDVGSRCRYALPGFSEQPFQGTLHVPNGEPSRHSSKDFGCPANVALPVQIRGVHYVCCATLLCFCLFQL